jgi:hypothetical protein
LFGGDFNLVRSSRDKNNGNINHKWADAFNGWINCWGLIEINSSNKMYTWTNNQDTPVLAKLDRIIATTDWEANFPLSKVKTLDRIPSDHNPLLLDTGTDMSIPKKKFRLEKWWLEKENFKEVASKAWSTPPRGEKPIDIWQSKIRTFRRLARGWASNEIASMNKEKTSLAMEFNKLESKWSRMPSLT